MYKKTKENQRGKDSVLTHSGLREGPKIQQPVHTYYEGLLTVTGVLNLLPHPEMGSSLCVIHMDMNDFEGIYWLELALATL